MRVTGESSGKRPLSPNGNNTSVNGYIHNKKSIESKKNKCSSNTFKTMLFLVLGQHLRPQ